MKNKSFTFKSDGLLNILKFPCHVSQSFDPAEEVPELVLTQSVGALWDTGAASSVINQRIVDACELRPVRTAQVHSVHGVEETEVYMVNIYLPNYVAFFKIPVFKAHYAGDRWDMLLGMDLISAGNLSVKNVNSKTEFEFSIRADHSGLIA